MFFVLQSSPGAVPLRMRLAVAAVQSFALFWLLEWFDLARDFWASHLPLRTSLLLTVLLVPVLALLGLGRLSARALFVWLVVATSLIAAAAINQTWGVIEMPYTASADTSRLYVELSIFVFVAHVLVIAVTSVRGWMQSYAVYYDTAWDLGIQLALTALFVVIFWGVLLLAAALFNLLQLNFFVELISLRFFRLSVTILATAIAIHVIDVHPHMVRGARDLTLLLLSWLLPLFAGLVAIFLCALPFVSLEALWQTRRATWILLAAAVLLILLLNCAYRDGSRETPIGGVRRIAVLLAAVELAPLAGLAATALGLRVDQHGWSVARIEVGVLIGLLSIYAGGYLFAVISQFRRGELVLIGTTNIVVAFAALAVFLALHTPLADPARLMVENQMARLALGAVAPESFDFAAMRFEGRRWGKQALQHLAEQGATDRIRTRAQLALTAHNPYELRWSPPTHCCTRKAD